jgi:hypothetical protein
MATVSKNFKVKNGLIVEGTTATVNNYDILTKKTDDQNYIIGLIGGTATPNPTPDTVVKRDGSGNFAANTITADLVGDVTGDLTGDVTGDLTGDVTGTVSDISNHSTTNLTEGTNLYFTEGRVHNSLSAGTGLLYDGGGEFSIDTTTTATKTYVDDEITDLSGTVATNLANAVSDLEDYADAAEAAAIAAAALDATTKANAAEVNAKAYTDTRETAITSAYQSYADTAEADAKAYTDTREVAITSAYQSYADTAEADAKSYTDTRETAITAAYQAYADQAELDAIAAAEAYADQKVAELVDSAPEVLDTLNELAAAIGDDANFVTTVTASIGEKVAKSGDTMTGALAMSNNNITGLAAPVNNADAATKLYVDTAEADANLYTDGEISDLDTALRAYADAAEADAISTAAADATTKANAAELAAKTYSDGELSDAITQEVADRNSAITSAINQEVSDRNAAITAAVNDIDTDDIEEGATNLYYTSTRATDAAGALLANATKTNIQIAYNAGQLTVTAENGVADSTTDDLDEGSQNLYFTNARAQSAVAGDIANAVSDINDTIDALTTNDVAEGSNLYFTDSRAVSALEAVVPNFEAIEIDSVAKQVAGTLSVPTASTVTGFSWAHADYRSAEFLVKVAYGSHTEISKVLLTMDTSDNIAITEYAIVGTNGSASTISADVDGANARLQVTTANNSSVITVVGTLLA